VVTEKGRIAFSVTAGAWRGGVFCAASEAAPDICMRARQQLRSALWKAERVRRRGFSLAVNNVHRRRPCTPSINMAGLEDRYGIRAN
jgi:hypothetical protein